MERELYLSARATLRPLVVSVAFKAPTISAAMTITPSPLAVSVAFKTPGTPAIVTPLGVSVTIITPTVV